MLATHDLASLPGLAERCVVLGEDHRVLADGGTEPTCSTIASLLVRANLVSARYGCAPDPGPRVAELDALRPLRVG